MIVLNTETESKEIIEKRLENWLDAYNRIKDKESYAYLQLLDSMRMDYEKLGDSDNCIKICKEIESFCIHTSSTKPIIEKMLLASYDSRARCGDFRAYCVALEWNRPINKQFFLPRKKILEKHGLIQAMQDVADDKLDFLFISMPPRTAKSTTGIFFLTFMAGLYPDRSILGSGHSASLTQSFYQECLNIMTSDEYRFKEIFRKANIVKQSAEYTWIDLDREKRFHTIMFRSIDGGTTGLAEASNVLYCDDLVKDIEQANNPDRLDKLFETYTSTVQDRKIQRLCKDGVYRPCPEIHIATRWSLRDPIGRLIDIYGEEDSDRIRVINIPCYDENGESNFLYDYGKGFSKEYYHHLQMAEVPEVFAAKYLGEPVERDGLVFTENTLTYYNELPEGKPDRIVAYGDVTHGGADYFALPIGYVYGYEVYIEDIFFEHNFGGDDYSRPRVCDTLIRNNVTRCGFESNNGGDFYSSLISQDLKMKNYRCNITTHTAKTNKSKMDRILGCQNEIKGTASESNTYRIYFKDKDARKNNPQYCAAMRQLFSWNQNPSAQKKQHDDFPDALAGMITNVLGGKQKGVARSDRKLVY